MALEEEGVEFNNPFLILDFERKSFKKICGVENFFEGGAPHPSFLI